MAVFGNPAPTDNTPSGLLAEVKAIVDKVIGQVVALGSYYIVLGHTDFTKLETAAGAALSAGIGYVINRLRSIKI